jgi:hypothetical protein
VVARDWGEGNGELVFDWHGISVFQDEKVSEICHTTM